MRRLRRRLADGLRDSGPFFVNSDIEQGLCNNLNGGFRGVPALALMRRMPHIHFSAGAACTTGATSSHVLEAIGLEQELIEASFRLSLGWSTTNDGIDMAVQAFRDGFRSFAAGR
jgi:cysteine desulfurase